MATTMIFTQAFQKAVVALNTATGFTATNPGTAPTNTVLLTVPVAVRTTTGGPNGSIAKSFVLSTDDTAAKTIQVWTSLDSGTTKYLLGTVPLVALSGSNGLVANTDVLSNAFLTGLPFDETGRSILMISALENIYLCVITAAITASKTVWGTLTVEDF